MVTNNELDQALAHISNLVNFAYEQGYHEHGYDPVEVVRTELARRSTSGSDGTAATSDAEEAAKLQTLLMTEFECYRTAQGGLMAWAMNALLDNSPHRMGRAPTSGSDETQSVNVANDISADYHYLLGLRAGWNLGMLNDNAGFNAAVAARQNDISEAKAELRAVTAQQSVKVDERALFEAWAKSQGNRRGRKGDGYSTEYTQRAWLAWQARAALAQQAAPVAPATQQAGAAVYQVQPNWPTSPLWQDVDRETYDVTMKRPNYSGRIVYASPAATTASASDSKSEFLAHLQRASELVETWPSWKKGMFAPETGGTPAPSRDAASDAPAAEEVRIPKWQDRLSPGIRFCPSITEMLPAMEAEIADLRAAMSASQGKTAASASEWKFCSEAGVRCQCKAGEEICHRDSRAPSPSRDAASDAPAGDEVRDAKDAARYRLLRDAEKVPADVWHALEMGEGLDDAMDAWIAVTSPIPFCDPCKAGRYAECEYAIPCTLPAMSASQGKTEEAK